MDDLWAGESQTKRGAWHGDGLPRVLPILGVVSGTAIGHEAHGILSSLDQAFMPIMDVVVESGHTYHMPICLFIV